MKLLLTSILLFVCISSHGQKTYTIGNDIERHGLYLEAYGGGFEYNSGPLALNYEYRLGSKAGFVLRIGYAQSFQYTMFNLPLTGTWLTGPAKRHHFEGGLGVSPRIEFFQGNVTYDVFVMIPLMYRFDSRSGFQLRAGLNYFSFLYYPVALSPSVSLGYRF